MQIVFSHHYPKLWTQRWAELIGVRLLNAKEVGLNMNLIEYDTRYYKAGKSAYSPLLKEGWLLQLVFLGNDHIPFCTLRPHNPGKEEYYRNQIGKIFDIRIGAKCLYNKKKTSGDKNGETNPVL